MRRWWPPTSPTCWCTSASRRASHAIPTAANWCLPPRAAVGAPTLLWAGADRCVAPRGAPSQAGAAGHRAGAGIPAPYHEIFNEPERAQVLEHLLAGCAPWPELLQELALARDHRQVDVGRAGCIAGAVGRGDAAEIEVHALEALTKRSRVGCGPASLSAITSALAISSCSPPGCRREPRPGCACPKASWYSRVIVVLRAQGWASPA